MNGTWVSKRQRQLAQLAIPLAVDVLNSKLKTTGPSCLTLNEMVEFLIFNFFKCQIDLREVLMMI